MQDGARQQPGRDLTGRTRHQRRLSQVRLDRKARRLEDGPQRRPAEARRHQQTRRHPTCCRGEQGHGADMATRMHDQAHAAAGLDLGA